MTMISEPVSRTHRVDAAPVETAPGPFSLHEKIDICRGLFAALVVMAHSLEIAWGVHPEEAKRATGSVKDIVFGVFGTGTYYVMGFFVLSGYCIHMSVARSLNAGRFSAGTYTVARMTRILPLYYIGLLVTLLVEMAITGPFRPVEWPNGLDLKTFLAQVVMIQNLTETFGSYASTWSITNEVFYYVFYGVLAAWLVGGKASRPAWVGLAICVVVAFVTNAWHLGYQKNRYVYSLGMLMGLGMLWFAGALVALHGKEWVKSAWVRRASACWPLVLVAAIAWKTMHMIPHGLYMISGLAFTLMMLHFLATSPTETPKNVGRWRAGIVSTFALASYPLYLFHGPLLMLVGWWIRETNAISDWRITWAVLMAIGLVSGTVLGWVLEGPLMAWRAGFLRSWKATLPPERSVAR